MKHVCCTLTASHRDAVVSQRSTADHISTTSRRLSETSQLPSLSSTINASDFIVYFGLLQVLTSSYFLGR